MCSVRCEASRLYSVKALTSLKIEWWANQRSNEDLYEPKTTHQKEVDRQDRWMKIIRGIECWQGRIIMMAGQHLNKALRERILLSWGCLQIHHVEIRIFRAQRFNILWEQGRLEGRKTIRRTDLIWGEVENHIGCLSNAFRAENPSLHQRDFQTRYHWIERSLSKITRQRRNPSAWCTKTSILRQT